MTRVFCIAVLVLAVVWVPVASYAGSPAASAPLSDLRISPDNLAPATMTVDRVESLAQADQEIFRQHHTQPYEALNWREGYFQSFDWPETKGLVAHFDYLASVYVSEAAAQQAFDDGHDATIHLYGSAAYDETTCIETFEVSCHNVSKIQGGDVYEDVLFGYCVTEVLLRHSDADASSVQQVGKIWHALREGPVNAITGATICQKGPPKPKPTPTPVKKLKCKKGYKVVKGKCKKKK